MMALICMANSITLCPFRPYGGLLAKFNELEVVPAVSTLRRDPRLLSYSPHVSALCIVVGVVWLLLLPLNNYSRQTYISENALLPGQVHTYFGGSEQYIFRAYKREVEALSTNETSGYDWSVTRYTPVLV